MRLRSTTTFALLAGAGIGCSQNTTPIPPAVLNRSGDVSLVCYDTASADDAALTLPLQCCAGTLPLATDFPACPVAVTTPVLHALVTQTARGEVAAVDLDNAKVVDSDKLIPGYTFVDVGGLPQALVVPKVDPGDAALGPRWAFAAGADLSVVQAVATCRFFRGERCGPELELSDAELDSAARIALPAPPADMVLSADGTALWVSLPDAGLLARVALSTDPALPFAMVGDAPAEPIYYPLPAASVAGPDAITAEDTPYDAICGLGHEVSEIGLTQPLAPRLPIDATRAAEPTRLRVDALTGLVFVADRGSAVLRAFREAGGVLTRAGEWGTGLPVTDFALTGEVPATAPAMDALISQTDVASAEAGPTVRYLYAIDNQGLVQVLGLAGDANAPMLQPIKPPAPSLRYADRLRVSGRAMALDVIDTRLREPYLCGADEANLDQRAEDKKAEVAAAKKAGKAELLAQREAELTVLQLEQSIRDTATPSQLRGVFVAVVSSTGLLDILDVADLDLACRAEAACENQAPYTSLRKDVNTTQSNQTLAVRRHAERLGEAASTTVTVAGETLLAPFDGGCADGYVPPDPSSTAPTVCVPSDPWLAADQTWSLGYEEAIPALAAPSGTLDVDADGALWLGVPAGFDLCARGLEVGDAIHIVVNPPASAAADCPRPVGGSALRLRVAEAFQERARVEVLDGTNLDASALAACYPDFFKFQTHTLGTYLVLGADGAYLHRITSDADGRCVPDETRDPRLESRLTPGTDGPATFQSPYVSFRVVQSDAPNNVAITVRITGQSTHVQRTIVDASGRADTLPSRVRYYPEAPHLYVVDAASQGLRRFDLSPALKQITAFR
jgi:hypothetical protein